MSSARVSSLLIAASMLLCSQAARADAPTVKSVEAKPASYALGGKIARTAVITDLHTAFVDGEHIGALHTGGACDAISDREWSELVRQRIETELPKAFHDEMTHARGLLPAAAGGAPLRVQAFLNNMDVQLCQAAGGWQGGFYVQVSWQIVSPDSGQVVYQASTEGSFALNEPQRIATVTGLREAFGVAARNLLADPRFAALLQNADQRRLALAY